MADIQLKEAALRGSLCRTWPAQPDRPAVARIPQGRETDFKALVNEVLLECSHSNVQKCKDYVIDFILPSDDRIQKFGSYLESLSKALPQRRDEKLFQSRGLEVPEVSMRRLFMLWLLSDVLYHTQRSNVAAKDPNAFRRFASNLHPYIVNLFYFAAELDRIKSPEDRAVHTRLKALVNDIWKERDHFTVGFVEDLNRIIDCGGKRVSLSTAGAEDRLNVAVGTVEDEYDLPAFYGEIGGQWYNQPAGVMLHQLSVNPGKEIKIPTMKPIPMTKGRASDDLINAVKDFLVDVKRSGNADIDSDKVHDMDDLGQHILKDPMSGDLSYGDTYYGFSRDFLETVKATQKWKDQSRASNPRTLDDIIQERGGHSGITSGQDLKWRRVATWSVPAQAQSSESRSPTPRRRSIGYSRSPTPENLNRSYSSQGPRDNQRNSRDYTQRTQQQSSNVWQPPAHASPPVPWQSVNQPPPPPPHNMPWPPPPPPPPPPPAGSSMPVYANPPPPPPFSNLPPNFPLPPPPPPQPYPYVPVEWSHQGRGNGYSAQGSYRNNGGGGYGGQGRGQGRGY